MKKIIAVNCSPRSEWNTSLLVRETARGAQSEGMEIEIIDLYSLKNFTGCVSCFGCKLTETAGKCVLHDGLSETMEKIRNADGLIIGSPIYLGNMTAAFRALYERLIFQYITYNKEKSNYTTHKIPVVMIVTSNCPEESYDDVGYTQMLSGYETSLSNFIGPVKTLIYSDTLQVRDYDKYNWTMFAPEHKHKRHDTVFPEKQKEAFAIGAQIAKNL